MMLSLIRKIASVLLLLCFVLPLSTCTSKAKPQSDIQVQPASNTQAMQKEATEDKSLYAFAILKGGWEDLQKNRTIGDSVTILMVLAVFFLPCGLLALKEKLQAIITIIASINAAFALFFWVFVLGTPQIGGVLAIMCWSSLLLVSLIYSVRWGVQWWRQRKLRNQ